ncbi:hypothetical protein [Pelagibacterium sp.]|uniref:hypothetical protein n=1 Tax=Pelagibacterium sp. TaxID=1967288 RepID=UPI003A9060B6
MDNVALSDPILSPLYKVIARRRTRTLARIALACALTALIALFAVLVLNRFARLALDAITIVSAVALATMLSGAIIAWLRRRSPVQEAFFIDHATGFGDAYGTAVDLVQGSVSHDNPVPRELLNSVRRRIHTVAPKRLLNIVTPGFAVAFCVATLLAIAIAWLLQMPPQPVENLPDPGQASQPAAPETITTLSQMLAEDAEARDDVLLGAIARTLAESAQTAGADGITDALAREINDLLDQAAATYGDNPPDWLGDADGTRLDTVEAGLQDMHEDVTEIPSSAPLAPVQGRGDAIQATPEAPGIYDTRPELAEQYGERTDDERLGNAEIVSNGEPPTDLGGSSSGEGPQLMEPQQLQSIGSIPVGAALESGRGLSNAAGLGEQDMQADDSFTQLGATPGEDMIVSAEPNAGGSRIRIEIAPQAGNVTDAGAANAIGGQIEAGSSEPVARDFIPFSARDITARYFERQPQ